MVFPIKKINKKGFALLFSVLVASLLLTIGLSIFRIALKELAISTAARQSVHAFYAADSGRECALYWDSKERIPYLFNVFDEAGGVQTSGGEITCGGKSIDLTQTQNSDNQMISRVESTIPNPANIDSVVFVSEGTSGPNFYVLIDRKPVTVDGSNKVFTTIKSYGQDSTGGDRVQRSIITSY